MTNWQKENEYQSFDGMVLTDTFQLYEQDRDMIANLLPDNSERRTKQKKREITVVIGNLHILQVRVLQIKKHKTQFIKI